MAAPAFIMMKLEVATIQWKMGCDMAKTDLKALRELAWIGDCILELYARSRVLRVHGGIDAEAKTRFTRNSFLNCLGNPTAMEARIGEVYQSEGLEAAHAWIAENIEPLFLKQEANREKQRPVPKRK